MIDAGKLNFNQLVDACVDVVQYAQAIKHGTEIDDLQSKVAFGQSLVNLELAVVWEIGKLATLAKQHFPASMNVTKFAGLIGTKKSDLYNKIALYEFYGDKNYSTIVAEMPNIKLTHLMVAMKHNTNATDAMQSLALASADDITATEFSANYETGEQPRYTRFTFTDARDAMLALGEFQQSGKRVEIIVKAFDNE